MIKDCDRTRPQSCHKVMRTGKRALLTYLVLISLGGEFALSLYRPVALFTVAVLGTAVAGIRVTIF